MPDYRRNRVPDGTFFFTVNLLDRRCRLELCVAPLPNRFPQRDGWRWNELGFSAALRLLLGSLRAASFRLRSSMARRWRQQQPERPTEIKSRIYPKLQGCVHLGVIDEE